MRVPKELKSMRSRVPVTTTENNPLLSTSRVARIQQSGNTRQREGLNRERWLTSDKKIPWELLLSAAPMAKSAINRSSVAHIFPADQHVTSSQIFPALVRTAISQSPRGNQLSTCPNCNADIQNQPFSTFLASQHFNQGEILLIALRIELITQRDTISWQDAASFYDAQRVIEDGELKLTEEAKAPSHLILYSIRLTEEMISDDQQQRIQALLLQHGELLLFAVSMKDSQKLLTPQGTVYSATYCPHCQTFFSGTDKNHENRSRAATQAEINDVLNKIAALEGFTEWKSYFMDPAIFSLLHSDVDFRKLQAAISAHYAFMESERTSSPFDSTEIELSKVQWLGIKPVILELFNCLNPTHRVTFAHPKLGSESAKNHSLIQTQKNLEQYTQREVFQPEAINGMNFLSFGNLEQKITRKYQQTIEARTAGFDPEQMRNDLSAVTVLELQQTFELEKEIYHLCEVLIAIGLGDLEVFQPIKLLLIPEQQRFWLLHKLIMNRRRKTSFAYIISEIESDAGSAAREQIFCRVCDFLKSRDAVFLSTYENDQELFTRYAPISGTN